MEPVPINRFQSGTGSIIRFQKKTGLPALNYFLKIKVIHRVNRIYEIKLLCQNFKLFLKKWINLYII